MSKPKLGYLLFDLPGDHEVEAALATECKVIESLIHNMRMKARVKRICVASTEKFQKYPTYRYRVQFVHLACHGGKNSIGMLGGTISGLRGQIYPFFILPDSLGSLWRLGTSRARKQNVKWRMNRSDAGGRWQIPASYQSVPSVQFVG